ncbi:uncharacterized protein LOC143020018 isoform X2 [Oratosquilla oratoria]|uniref:uncharacterized protein LOC143020018 isoform X2 n=1 Tax=Oratosquilla oratoria TaxID=337810 RepID=UPI003F76F130
MYAKTAWSVLQEGTLQHHHPLPSLSPSDKPEDADQSSNFISTIANFTSSGSLAWRAWGPSVEVLDPTSGVRKAAWTFGALLQNNGTKVTCACEVGIGTTSHMIIGLDLGPDKGSCGMICLLSLQSSKIIRSVYLPYKVMSICMVTGGMYAVDVGTLAPELRSMRGIVAVGMAQGRVSLIDLVLDVNGDIFLSDEVSPSSLLTQHVPDPHPEARRREAISKKNHLELCLSDGMSSNGNFSLVGPDEHILFETAAHKVTVTALLYVPQIASLVVGYNFGAFQVYNLSKLAIECASPFEENMPPVQAFAYQEPENDPRNFVYMWLSRSWKMLDGNVSPAKKSMPALCTLYAMNYDKKEWIEGHGLWYQGLLSISPRFEFEALGGLGLEGRPTAPSVVFTTSSVIQSTLTTGLPTTLTAPDEETSPVPELSLCVFGWTGGVLEKGHIAVKNYFAVFDINQWYQAQMPFSLNLESDQLCPYMSLHTLDCNLVQNQGEIILSAAPKAATWTRHKSTMHNDKDWYPSSLSYDLCVITSSSILKFHCSSAQSSVLSCLVQGGPVTVVSPSQAYKLCILAGLIPNDTDSPTATKSLIKEREMVLKIALDHQLVCFLVNCVEEFAEGRFTHLGCSLSTLLDWAWHQVYNLKDSNNSLCAPLFDVDVGVVSQESICSLYQNLTLLSTLQSVITAIRNNAHAVTSRSADELDGKVMVVTLLHLHLQVVLWFYHCKLLPQRDEENMLDDSDVPYPVSLLQKIYANRRAAIKGLSSSLDGTEILLIDGLLEDTHEAVGKLWSREGGSTQYPPPSLHALLAMYLLPDVPTTTKHRIVQYLFLDLASLLSDGFVNVVEELVKFPSSFSLSPSLIKLSQAFWLIDHKDFQEGLNVLLDPLINSKDIAVWQHRRIIKALLYQGEHSRALSYARIRRPPLVDVDDIRLHLTLLLANGLTREAFHYQRTHRVQANTDDLLNHFFTGCEEMGKLQTVIQLPLNKLEEDSFIAYLQSSTKPSAIDLLIVYYLQRSRYVEVLELQNQLHSYGHLGTSRKRHGARTALVDGFLAQLPDESKKIVDGLRRSTYIYTKPKPLSAHIRQLKHERMSLSSRRQLQQGTSPVKQDLSAPFTPFRNKAQRRKYAGLESEPDTDILNHSGRGTKRDVSHIIFPKHLEFSASDSLQQTEAPVTPSAKRRKTNDSLLGHDTFKLIESLHEKCHRMSTLYMEDSYQDYNRSRCHNVSAEVLSLLQTPPVHKKISSSHAGQAADSSMADITTPQSILKVRKMLQRSRSPSVASESSTTSFPSLRKPTNISEENVTTEAAITPKQLRFHLPVKEVNMKEVDVPEHGTEEEDEQENVEEAVAKEEEEETVEDVMAEEEEQETLEDKMAEEEETVEDVMAEEEEQETVEDKMAEEEQETVEDVMAEEEQEIVEDVMAEEEKEEEEVQKEEILEVSTTDSEPDPEVLTDDEKDWTKKNQEAILKRISRSPSPEDLTCEGVAVPRKPLPGYLAKIQALRARLLDEDHAEAEVEETETEGRAKELEPSEEEKIEFESDGEVSEKSLPLEEEIPSNEVSCLASANSSYQEMYYSFTEEETLTVTKKRTDIVEICLDSDDENDKEYVEEDEDLNDKGLADHENICDDNEEEVEKELEVQKVEEEKSEAVESSISEQEESNLEEKHEEEDVEGAETIIPSEELISTVESEPLEASNHDAEERVINDGVDTATRQEDLEHSEHFDPLVFSDEELENCQEEAAETEHKDVEELDAAELIGKSLEKANNNNKNVVIGVEGSESHGGESEQKLNLNETEQMEGVVFSDNEESSQEESMIVQQESNKEIEDVLVTGAIEMTESAELLSSQDTATGQEESFEPLVFSDEEPEGCQEEAVEIEHEDVEDLDVAPEKANNNDKEVAIGVEGSESHGDEPEQKLNLNETEQFEDLVFSDSEESSQEESLIEDQKEGELVSVSEANLTPDTKDEEEGNEKESVEKEDEPDSVKLSHEVKDDSEYMEPVVITGDEREDFKDEPVEKSLQSQGQDLSNEKSENVFVEDNSAVEKNGTSTVIHTSLEVQETEITDVASIITETVSHKDDSAEEEEKDFVMTDVSPGETLEGRDNVSTVLEKCSTKVEDMETEESVSLKGDEMKRMENIYKEDSVVQRENATSITERSQEEDEMERKEEEELEGEQSAILLSENKNLEEKNEILGSGDIEQNVSGRDDQSSEMNDNLEQKTDMPDEEAMVLTSGLGDAEDVPVSASETQLLTTEEVKVVESIESEIAEGKSAVDILPSNEATAQGQSVTLQDKCTTEMEKADIELVKTEGEKEEGQKGFDVKVEAIASDQFEEKPASSERGLGKVEEDVSEQKLQSPMEIDEGDEIEATKISKESVSFSRESLKEGTSETVMKEVTVSLKKMDDVEMQLEMSKEEIGRDKGDDTTKTSRDMESFNVKKDTPEIVMKRVSVSLRKMDKDVEMQLEVSKEELGEDKRSITQAGVIGKYQTGSLEEDTVVSGKLKKDSKVSNEKRGESPNKREKAKSESSPEKKKQASSSAIMESPNKREKAKSESSPEKKKQASSSAIMEVISPSKPTGKEPKTPVKNQRKATDDESEKITESGRTTRSRRRSVSEATTPQTPNIGRSSKSTENIGTPVTPPRRSRRLSGLAIQNEEQESGRKTPRTPKSQVKVSSTKKTSTRDTPGKSPRKPPQLDTSLTMQLEPIQEAVIENTEKTDTVTPTPKGRASRRRHSSGGVSGSEQTPQKSVTPGLSTRRRTRLSTASELLETITEDAVFDTEDVKKDNTKEKSTPGPVRSRGRPKKSDISSESKETKDEEASKLMSSRRKLVLPTSDDATELQVLTERSSSLSSGISEITPLKQSRRSAVSPHTSAKDTDSEEDLRKEAEAAASRKIRTRRQSYHLSSQDEDELSGSSKRRSSRSSIDSSTVLDKKYSQRRSLRQSIAPLEQSVTNALPEDVGETTESTLTEDAGEMQTEEASESSTDFKLQLVEFEKKKGEFMTEVLSRGRGRKLRLRSSQRLSIHSSEKTDEDELPGQSKRRSSRSSIDPSTVLNVKYSQRRSLRRSMALEQQSVTDALTEDAGETTEGILTEDAGETSETTLTEDVGETETEDASKSPEEIKLKLLKVALGKKKDDLMTKILSRGRGRKLRPRIPERIRIHSSEKNDEAPEMESDESETKVSRKLYEYPIIKGSKDFHADFPFEFSDPESVLKEGKAISDIFEKLNTEAGALTEAKEFVFSPPEAARKSRLRKKSPRPSEDKSEVLVVKSLRKRRGR